MHPFFSYKTLNGEELLDGSLSLDQEAVCEMPTGMEFGLALENGNCISTCTVVIKKDLWHLDGLELLDGSRILDAEEREEEL